MNTKRKQIDLDELIGKAIDTTDPVFDAGNWQAKYSRQLEMLGSADHVRPGVVIRVFQNRIAQVAAAAVLITAASVLVVQQGPVKPDNEKHSVATPAQMTTAQSLRQAFRSGGLDALEQHCDEAIRVLGPTAQAVSLADMM